MAHTIINPAIPNMYARASQKPWIGAIEMATRQTPVNATLIAAAAVRPIASSDSLPDLRPVAIPHSCDHSTVIVEPAILSGETTMSVTFSSSAGAAEEKKKNGVTISAQTNKTTVETRASAAVINVANRTKTRLISV